MSHKPRHWPDNVLYIQDCPYHRSVPKHARDFVLGTPTIKRSRQGQSGRANVIIRAITSPEHPAFGQYGLFAARKISPDTHIIDYVGEIHCEERPDSDYDISLHRYQDGLSIGVDASSMGNEARFINDFRGIRPKPNASFAERRNGDGELTMSIRSSKDIIKKGEEILVSYGKSWWRARSNDS
ncbi:hypothetical protein HGRIS_007578 [Hohenbuehelia grisea]|uniref:SET domain-containing protein n=1 Tax=Hohenbuehelia grisea TaxID=104357 RepID=A0ABR3J5A7_9AGAR